MSIFITRPCPFFCMSIIQFYSEASKWVNGDNGNGLSTTKLYHLAYSLTRVTMSQGDGLYLLHVIKILIANAATLHKSTTSLLNYHYLCAVLVNCISTHSAIMIMRVPCCANATTIPYCHITVPKKSISQVNPSHGFYWSVYFLAFAFDLLWS